MLDVLRVGCATGSRSDAPLELDEGVQRGQVHGPSRRVRGRVLLNHLLATGQASKDEKVPHRAGDVGLGLTTVVPSQDLSGGVAVFGVVYVDVDCQSRPQFAQVLQMANSQGYSSPSARMECSHSPTRGRVEPVNALQSVEVGVRRDDANYSQPLHHRRVNQVSGADAGMAVRQLRRRKNVFGMDGFDTAIHRLGGRPGEPPGPAPTAPKPGSGASTLGGPQSRLRTAAAARPPCGESERTDPCRDGPRRRRRWERWRQ